MAEFELKAQMIKELRKKMGWSQQDLAKLLDVGIASISRWENGEKKPTGTAGVILASLVAALVSGLNPNALKGAALMPGSPIGSAYGIYQMLKKIFKNGD